MSRSVRTGRMEPPKSTEERIENVISFMLSSLDRNLWVDELAESLQAVAVALRGAVQETDWILAQSTFSCALKMQRACRLLETSDHADQGNRNPAGHRRSALFLAQLPSDLRLFADRIPPAAQRLRRSQSKARAITSAGQPRARRPDAAG